MIDYLNSIDTQLFLYLNGLHNSFFDFVMYWLSDKYIWVPLYLFIIYLVIKRYKMKGLYLILFTLLVVVSTDQISSHLIKAIVQRLRPSHEPSIAEMVHLSKEGSGGLYGFVSSHSANAFGIVMFLALVIGKEFRILIYSLFIWAFFVSYSRIYNGVHYPGDVVCGIILGLFLGWFMAKLYKRLGHKYENFNLKKSNNPNRKHQKVYSRSKFANPKS